MTNQRSWRDMDYDILVRIFMALNITDLITGVAQVCNSWRTASCDPCLWRKLDLSTLKPKTVSIPPRPYPWSDQESSRRLKQIMKNAFYFSRGNATHFIFHYFVFLQDEHLIYAAQSNPNLKQLVLPARNYISKTGFQQAFQRWSTLESLTVPCVICPYYMVEAIGKSCRNFYQLKVLCPFDMEFAEALIKHIPKLKILSLRCSLVYTEAINRILKSLEHLEVLNLSHSIFVGEPDQGAETRMQTQKDCDIAALLDVSRLKRVITCKREACLLCKHKLDDFHVGGWCCKFQEAIWREDEVTSLAH
ncbi:F-box/LRR-repeat protein [Quillaja saponaria]|uniref:F-box/LRR-repeat protein n=1 Tax=Quillaja saponaria TaxID=32244 RepID=A0AAD7PE59_QUISA|nr:F-box/LRR-repeat protein [Quillaja saponaria]